MKVIILGTRGFPNVQGGVEAHCEGLAIGLTKLGCDVTVFTRKPYLDPSIKKHMGVRLFALPALHGKCIETISHTCLGTFAAWSVQPDLLHLHGIGPALFIVSNWEG